MISIIIGLLATLIIFVVVVSAFQQHKEKQNAEKRAKVARQKAIMDENEELLLNLTNLPDSPTMVQILLKRSVNAAKIIQELMPELKSIKARINDLLAQLKASKELVASHNNDDNLILPENEQQILAILQCIKKLRAILKSEHKKGVLDPQAYTQEDQRLDAMQLKINIESLIKRGRQAHGKEMFGSARQYYEKALQTLTEHPIKSDYINTKNIEITEQLTNIADSLKSTNASDAAKKAKDEVDDLDILFQPKKKW